MRGRWPTRRGLKELCGSDGAGRREGECVGGAAGRSGAAGEPIVTIMDLTQTWVYAPLPETQADAVQLGDSLRVVMPSGETV